MRIFTKLKAGNIKLQEIGLLHYICGHLKGGIFDQSLPEIADATNFAVSTVHHFLGRLVECGFLKVVRPSVKTKTGNTPVGYQPIPPIEWGRFVDAKGSYEGDPIQKGMIHKIHSVCVCVEKECGMNLIDKGAIPPIEWAAPIDSAVRQVLTSIEHRREMAGLAASYWGRVIVPEPVKIIQPEPQKKSGMVCATDIVKRMKYTGTEKATSNPATRTFRIPIIGGVREVEGMDYKDAERKIIGEVEAYRNWKCGE